MQFQSKFCVLWSDLDPNHHVHHTVFSKYASETRIAFFVKSGLLPDYLSEHSVGPILFREEICYYNEVRLGQILTVNCAVVSMPENASKINIKNDIIVDDKKKAATIYTTTMWLDLINRKLVQPPEKVREAFQSLSQN
jgi:acyl-CoA thioester hydrolase